MDGTNSGGLSEATKKATGNASVFLEGRICFSPHLPPPPLPQPHLHLQLRHLSAATPDKQTFLPTASSSHIAGPFTRVHAGVRRSGLGVGLGWRAGGVGGRYKRSPVMSDAPALRLSTVRELSPPAHSLHSLAGSIKQPPPPPTAADRLPCVRLP